MNNGVRQIRRRSAFGRAAGFSLVEILVVLAILVIGVLAILRIFPYGFLAIQHTTEQTNAQALIHQQLEQQKNADSVPESIVTMDPTTGTIRNDVLPDDLTAGGPLGSDVNKIRYVVGETFRIPIAFSSPDPSATGNYGAVYMAQFGPIYYNPSATTQAQMALNPQVTGAPLHRVEQSSLSSRSASTTPNVTSDGEYAIDYDNLKIAFYPHLGIPTKGRTFQFNYTFLHIGRSGGITATAVLSGSNKIYVPNVNPLTPSDLVVPIWQDIFDNTNNVKPLALGWDDTLKLKRDSEDVSRAFAFVPASGPPAWTDDPYEYSIYSPSDFTFANIGVFLFNPHGRTTTVTTATGTEAFTARLSYQIFDNHIIRDQRSIPSGRPYDIHVSLPFVSSIGDVQLDQSEFTGLYGGTAQSPAILAYNPNNGQMISAGTGECQPGQPVGTTPGGNNFTLDAKTGVIHFDPTFIETYNLQNTTIRLYYHTQKNFGLQVQKANAHYYLADTVGAVDYHSYYVGTGAGGFGTGAGLPTRVYFPKCETGKTVVLGDYYANIKNADGTTTLQHFTGETYQISSNTGLQVGINLPYVDILSQHPDATGFAAPSTGLLPVDNVQGVSMKARVIWLRSVQMTEQGGTMTPVYHWRKIDNDTILLPATLR